MWRLTKATLDAVIYTARNRQAIIHNVAITADSTPGQTVDTPVPGSKAAVDVPKKTMTLKAYTALKKKANPKEEQPSAEEEQQTSTPSSRQINGDEGSSTPRTL
jgi:hypothetical protein